jgi:hypothetical protein
MENNRNDIKEFVDYMASSFPHPLEPFRAELHGEDLEKSSSRTITKIGKN